MLTVTTWTTQMTRKILVTEMKINRMVEQSQLLLLQVLKHRLCSSFYFESLKNHNKHHGVLSTDNGAAAPKLVISEEEYDRITQALVIRLRQHEETVNKDSSELPGIRQKELIRWYIDQQNEKKKYSSQEQVKLDIKKLRAIIESLVCKEGHLIVLANEQEATEDEETRRRSSQRDERILAVAPNYVIE